MNVEIIAIVAIAGLGISLVRWASVRLGAQTVAEIDLEERVTDRALGVRDGGRLDIWVAPGSRVPAKVVRLVRGRPEPGRGLRLSLYEGADEDASNPVRRVVRTWLGPYPDRSDAVLVEVTLVVGRFGQLRLQGIDKATGRRLQITRDERNAAPQTVITTRQALMGELDEP